MGWLVMEIFALTVATLGLVALGIFVGFCLLPRLGFSERIYRHWLLDQRLGDYIRSLRENQVSYVQHDVDEYTITLQKIRFIQEGQVPFDDLPENYYPEGNNA